MTIEHIFVSQAHNYFGHHGQPPGDAPMEELEQAELVAGKGIVGDRFFNFKTDYKGQVTFFAREVFDRLCAQFQVWDRPPSVFRRNIIVSGVDLNALVGKRFQIGEVEFEGISECSPCHWMDLAFHPGSEAALAGQGGLRAVVRTSGSLRVGTVAQRIT